ncbi:MULTISPECIES: BlaI/MecI/CopY family transcriptional regulator [Nocardioides]|uniref:BlaI/MecI/CopY family transcriptional regulator n=1 Tax=Nocardioides piscis TaxID=2714938 RepID=A0A6G7YG42_9ACTN|nr:MULTISPECIES: BlaI/MecI/CopY family transcriptional regulator [Nocardioides]QIK75775.1 BlaI/MecI/CopY family transcriptional regulator [Nocardioides piscis]
MFVEKGAAIVSHLGQLEAAVMECLWAHDEAMPVREVLTELNGSRELAYTTVMTVLDNLHRKGMVARSKAGRAWVYIPVGSRSSYTAELMEEALAGNPDRGAALLHFVEKLPADELMQLRQLLDPTGPDPSVTSKSPASETARQL